MTEQEILAGLGEIIEDMTERPADQVTLDKSFEELDIDSLMAVEIVAAVEDKYHVKVSDKQLEDLKSVQHVVTFVAKNTEDSKSAGDSA